jgi:DNA-binding transcriptional LysR family regulator
LARKSPIDAKALRQYGLATITLTPAVQETVARQLGFDAAEFPLAAECDDINTLLHLVLGSDVIGLLPHTLIPLRGQKLRRLSVAGMPDLHAHIHAIWLNGRTLAPATRRAIELAQTVSTELLHKA